MNSVPTHMNAIVLEQAGGQPILKQIPIPIPNVNQVLIKVDSAPINPSDLSFLRGQYQSVDTYPVAGGKEGSGVVVSEGDLQGKRVSFNSYESGTGSYAEYAVADKSYCWTINDNISLQIACSSFINPVTVIGMLEVVQTAKVSAVVHTAAASQLGRMMVRYFQENGVKVINVVRRQEQADILKSEGAEYTLNQTDADFFEKLTALTTELKATICFDAIGGVLTGKILSALPNKSIIYNYGRLAGQNISEVSVLDLIFKEKTLKGFLLSSWLKKCPNRIQECQLKIRESLGGVFKSVIAKEVQQLNYVKFNLEQFEESLKYYLANMTQGKTLIRPNLST